MVSKKSMPRLCYVLKGNPKRTSVQKLLKNFDFRSIGHWIFSKLISMNVELPCSLLMSFCWTPSWSWTCFFRGNLFKTIPWSKLSPGVRFINEQSRRGGPEDLLLFSPAGNFYANFYRLKNWLNLKSLKTQLKDVISWLKACQ